MGGTGRDAIVARGGNVTVQGDAGDDRIRTGGGNDRVSGGPGRDRISTGPGDDRVDVRDGARDVVRCGDGNDTAIGDAIDRLIGCESSG
jgi:Ca2+-binding RTX toxin-like protein